MAGRGMPDGSIPRHASAMPPKPTSSSPSDTGGQSQFSEVLSLQAAEDKIGALQRWGGKHLAEGPSLPVLASRAGMSERSFSRHYAGSAGLTPARAVERLRVEGARRLLLDTRLPVKRISQRCGFGSEETSCRRELDRRFARRP